MARAIELAQEATDTVRAAREKLATLAQRAELMNDPMGPYLDALSTTLDAQHRLFVDGAQTMEAAARAAQQPIDRDAVAQIGQTLADGMRARVVEWTTEHAREQARANWRRDLAVVFGLVLAIGVAAGAGYHEGWSHGIDTAHETEAGLRAAFSAGEPSAATWLKWMSWNDADAALAKCKGVLVTVQDGRKGCTVPLWIEPPKSPQPNG